MADKDIQNTPFESTQMEPTIYTPYETSNPEIGGLLKNIGKDIGAHPNSSEYNSTVGLGKSQFDVDVPYESMESIDAIRSERQPWYDQAASFLNQAVVGEVIGGTLMSIGAIIDSPMMIANAINGTEEEFSNGLYELGDSISQWTRDVTPIYQTGDRFGDSGWWWQNGVSIASTLSMMIPGMGASKAVGAIGKALKLGTTATRIAQTGLGALTMRHAENFREAHDVFNTVYKMGIEAGKGEELSRKAASDAASLDYQANYANLAFDVIQMGAILRPFAGLTRNISMSGKVASAADKTLANAVFTPSSRLGKVISRIKDPARIGLSEWTEGIEEGINTISQFEGIRQGRIDLGLEKEDGSDLFGRIGKYLGTEEMQDSMLWGMIGGMAFKGVAGAIGFDENASITKNKIAEIASRGERINHYTKLINAALNNTVVSDGKGRVTHDFTKLTPDEKQVTVENIRQEMVKDLAFNAAKAGNIDVLLAQVKDSKFLETLETAGIGTKEELAASIPELTREIEQYESIYKKHFIKLFESPIDQRVKNIIVENNASLEAKMFQNNKELDAVTRNLNELKSKDLWYNNQTNKQDIDITVESIALQYAKAELEKVSQDSNLQEATKSAVTKAINSINQRIKEVAPVSKPVTLAAIDQRIIDAATEEVMIRSFNSGLAEVLETLTSKENVAKQAKDIKQNIKALSEELNNNKKSGEVEESKVKRKEAKDKVDSVLTEVIEPETPPVVEGDVPVAEDFEVIETPEVVETTKDLEFDGTPLGELLDKTDVSLSDKVEDKVAKINEAWQKELTAAEEAWANNVDERGYPKESFQPIKEEIDNRYKALLDTIPTTEEVIQAETQQVIDNATFNDGDNIEVNKDIIEVEEDSDLIDDDTLRRNQALAINYLVSKYNVEGTTLLKNTVNIKESNPDALVASEWNEFTPGTKLVLSLDTQFSGETYQYVSESISDDIEAKKADIERRRREEFKGNIVEEVKAYTITVRGKQYEIYEEKYDKNSPEYFLYVKRDNGEIISTSKNEDIIFNEEGKNKQFLSDVTSEWIDTELQSEINAKYDAELASLEKSKSTSSKSTRVLSEGKPVTYQRTFKQIFTEDKINSPIKIQAERNGNLITVGYLPTIGWLQSVDGLGAYENLSNTETYPAEEQIAIVRNIREAIVNSPVDTKFNFIVEGKGLGKLAITTDRDGNNKKVLAPVTEAMPNYITSKYFSGTVKPFTVFNKVFLVNKDTAFGGNIAISGATKEALEATGAGAVFMMIPTAVPGTFIPTPVAVPLVPNEVATMISEVVSAAAFQDNPELLSKVRYSYGNTISTRKDLKEFLDKFLYFTSVEDVTRTYGDGRVRVSFDTKNSIIYVNEGTGLAPYKLALNTAKSSPEQLETNLRKFAKTLTNAKLSVKLNSINSEDVFAEPVIAEDGTINFEESTYNNFLAKHIKTDLVELTSANGTPVYVVQPVITIAPSQDITKPKDVVTEESLAKDLEGISFEGFEDIDDLVGTEGAVKPGVSELFESNPELANQVYEALGFNNTKFSISKEESEKVDKIFKKYPELAKLFNNDKQLYNNYLKSIFPNSSEEFAGKLFFHGTKNPIEGGKFKISDRNLAKGLWFTKQLGYAKRIQNYKDEEDNPITYGVILNIKNPKHFYNSSGALLVQRPSDFEKEYDRRGNDAAVFHHPESSDGKFTNQGGYNQVVVFDENQVHIIGDENDLKKAAEFLNNQITPQQKQQAQQKFQEYVNATGKQDIEGFKEFVDNQADELISPEQSLQIREFATNFLIKDGDYTYSSETQRVITKTIAAEVYTQFLEYDKTDKKLPVNVALLNAKKTLSNRLENTINKLIELGEEKFNKALADVNYSKNISWIGSYNNLFNLQREYERLLKPEVWSQFEKEVINNLQNLGINVKNGKAEDFTRDEVKGIEESLEELTVEGNDGLIEKSFNDFATFQMDSKDTASWRVKLALSTIKSGERNFLGTAEYLPFDTVFDDLQNTLSGVEGTLTDYINTLHEVSMDNPAKGYLKNVVKFLKSPETTTSLKNNFVSVMRRAHNEFLLLKWKRGANGWTLNVIESNRHSVVNKIIESWNENFKVTGVDAGLIKTESGELVINKDKAGELLTELKGLKTTDEKIAFADKLMEMLGIDLPEPARKTLHTAGMSSMGVYSFGMKGNFDQQFDFTKSGEPNGLFSFIVNALATESNTDNLSEDVDKLSLNNPFTGEHSEKAVKFLANLASKYGLKLDTNTFRNVESKQIYQYSFYTPERLEIERLNKDAAYRAAKGKAVFSSDTTSRYLQLLNAGRTLEYSYVDGMSQVQSSKSGVTRGNMSSREQYLLAIAQFQKHNTVAGYLGLTHSDKSVAPVIDFEKLKIAVELPEQFDGVVTSEMIRTSQLDKTIRQLVQAEVNRILNIVELKDKANKEGKLAELKNNLGSQYFDGAEYFYFFPELNALVRDDSNQLSLAALENLNKLVEAVYETTIVPTINNSIQEMENLGIVYQDSKTGDWFTMFKEGYVKNVGYGRDSGKEGLSRNEVLKLTAIAAADMDINYIIHNANMIMLVHGDPALEFKKDVDTTLVEYQKRLAKDVAPGALGNYDWSIVDGDNTYYGRPYYNVVFLKDITNPTETEGYIRSLPGYTGSLDRTDAQEWTTAEEHLNVLMSYGRISDVMYKRMMGKISTAKTNGTFDYEFTDEELDVVLQPMKPVQVMSSINPQTGIEESYYIKSSSYPLIPQLTRGLDLEKIRVAMEKSGIDRAAFKTATKIGHKKLVEIADKDGNIKENIDFSTSVNQLSREGFSIQQDVPYEEGKHRIVTISQMNKLLFEGISDLNFGKFTGADLKARKELVRTKLFELSAKELYGRMGIKIIDGAPVVSDKVKLMQSVKEEAVKRGWALNDIESLSLDENGNFLIPLAFNNSASRIESLILSMFTNTIIKQKINGKSLVQGTSSGFKNNVKTLDEIKDSSGIVFVKDKFNPAKGLQYLTILEDGKTVQRAQVFIPWKFAGKLEDFVNSEGYLDLERLDPELLNLIGARIPNQGHSSQLAIEVVGFLPHSMGDLVIVPGEITKQMGSDFDVDKLYTYIYNSILNEEGSLVKIPNLLDDEMNFSIEKYNKFLSKQFPSIVTGRKSRVVIDKDKLKELNLLNQIVFGVFDETAEDLSVPTENTLYRMALENEYIGIHNTILTNPEVAKKCLMELDQDDLKVTGKVGRQSGATSNYLTVRRQLDDYRRQKAGKDGVGVMSRAVVGAAVIQDYNLRLTTLNSKRELIDNPFRGFADDRGNPLNLVSLSGIGTSEFEGNKRSKVGNLIIQQSGAVDNSKTPVLDMNNLNMNTFNASIAISLLQTDTGKALDLRYNAYFLKQEIIQEYVRELSMMVDSLNSEFISNKKDLLIETLGNKYIKRAGLTSYSTIGRAFNAKELEDLLTTENINSPEYVKAQLEILEHFLTLDAIGQELSEIFTAISTDSKGLGKSYWESSLRQEQIEGLEFKSLISGAQELVRNNENGAIAKYVTEANKVMGQLFPYTTDVVNAVIKNIEAITGRNERIDVEFRRFIWDEFRRYVLSNNKLDVSGNRQELFYSDNSMAKRVEAAKNTWAKNNLFVMKLRPVKATKPGNPDLVTFAASLAERTDEAEVIKSFTDLFISDNPDVRQFAEDLVKYAYTTGGVQQALEYIKYIPTAYLRTTNLANLVETTLASSDESIVNNFIEQFFQHNPNYPKKVVGFTPGDSFTLNAKDNSDLLEEVRTPDGIVMKFPEYLTYRDEKKWKLYKNAGGGEFIRIPLLGGKGKDLTSYNEYNFNSGGVSSTIPNNNISTTKEVEIQTIPQVIAKEEPMSNPVSEEVSTQRYVNNNLSGVAAVRHLVNNLTEERFRALGQILLDNSAFISSKLTISTDNNLTSNNTNSPSRGKYNDNTKQVIINPKLISFAEKFFGREVTNRAYEAALLHELLHGFTSEAYNKYKSGEELPPNVIESFKRIEGLYATALSKLSEQDLIQLDKVKKYVSKGTNKQLIFSNDKEKADAIDKYYGFTSVKEFISEAMSNSEFQKILNDMQFTNKKTFLQRFLDLVKNLFPNLKQNSVLEATFVEVVELLENQSNTVIQQVATISEQIYPQLGGKTQSENVVIAGKGDLTIPYKGKNFWNEIVPEARSWYENEAYPIIIAYRGNKNKTFLENYKSNTIGNPFDWQVETGSRKEQGVKSTKKFIEWMITGNNFGELKATEEYRQAIIKDIKEGKWANTTILYYEEKGYATHATALDYLINKYNWNQNNNVVSTEQVVGRPEINSTKTAVPTIESSLFSKPTFSYRDITIDTDFKLGNDQSMALQTLVDFVRVGNSNHPEQNVITLEGAAGTGKTAIIGYLQKYFGRNKSFAFLAPTHAATAELAFATVKSGNIYLPSTIQSAITYNKLKDSYVFTKKILNKIGMYSPVIVVDEASMIDSSDINNLIQAVEDVGGRLILMGDEKQIPKVSQSSASTKPLSPAFTDFRKVTLNKVFRQSEGSLLNLLTAMRNQTEFKLFKVPNSESIKFLNRREYNEELIKDVKNNPEGTVVISYTNSSVKDTNSSIRKLLGRTGETVVGDIVVGYLGYASKQVEKGDIANSINYTITDIVDNGSIREIYVKSTKLKKLIDSGIVDIRDIAITNYYQLSKTDSLTFDSLTEDDYLVNNDIVASYFRILHKNNVDYAAKKISYATYLSTIAGISEGLRKVSVGNDYVYNPATDRMEIFDKIKHSGIKTNGQGSLLMNKDIDYGHAITIHKSQGTTIDKVYFDTSSLKAAPAIKVVTKNGVTITTEAQALAYVAMSRAKNKLVVYEGDMGFEMLKDLNTLTSPTPDNVLPNKPESFTAEEGDFTMSLLPGIDNLGTTVGEYMKDLAKDERNLLRKMLSDKIITVKCK